MKKKYLYTDAQVSKKFYAIANKAVKKKIAKPFDEDFYAFLSISSPRFAEFLKDESTLGKCYVFALLLSQSIPNCTLVHGVLQNLNKSVGDVYIETFDHAWVECENLVFDTTSKCCFDKNKYYKLYDVDVSKRFTQQDLKKEETLVNLAKSALKIHREMQEPLCSFSPFKALQSKIKPQREPLLQK